MSKPIKLETNAFEKAIEGVLCQHDKKINGHPTIYYLHKMLLDKRNYETHDAKLLAIIEGFKTWRYHLEGAAYTILLLMDYNNLNKFIKITCLSNCPIQ